MAHDTSPLPAGYIAAQKARLLDLLEELGSDDRASAAEEAELQADSLDEPQGSGDDAQKTNLRDNNAALIEHNAARLTAVKRALQKIEDGTYGLSDRSGDPIPKARLDVLPESLWTVEEDASE
ncbi:MULTISPECIES: TraR/DksA family transcriptional regulator [Luteimonas]|uniref:TraR/DksA family transcriptional regulator n=1 Tax=Luteimonas TaxID=83614 RepID=UPI000C7AF9E7|nr:MULTISPECIES: conjugal transfer protein TraR [Luteimonas]